MCHYQTFAKNHPIVRYLYSYFYTTAITKCYKCKFWRINFYCLTCMPYLMSANSSIYIIYLAHKT